MTILFAENTIKNLEQLYDNKEFEKLESELKKVDDKYIEHPAIKFFQATVENEPAKAVKIYKELLNSHPESTYADDALCRLGQFYYVEGDFEKARQHFSFLSRNYPNSPLKDDAQYLYCLCIMAQGKIDSAKLFLNTLINKSPRSQFVDLAILDLENLKGIFDNTQEFPKHSQKRYYTIELGRFQNRNNAERVVKELEKKYSFVSIGEKKYNGTLYYLVLLGKFQTEMDAEKFASGFIAHKVNNYKVILYQ